MITNSDALTTKLLYLALPWETVQTKPSLTSSILVPSVFSNPAYAPLSGIRLDIYVTS